MGTKEEKQHARYRSKKKNCKVGKKRYRGKESVRGGMRKRRPRGEPAWIKEIFPCTRGPARGKS